MKYNYSEEYSTDFLDKIYLMVEYYLANSKQELVVSSLEDPEIQIEYSIEEGIEGGKEYYKIGIGYYFEHHNNIMQWIYISSNEKPEIFEYDIATEKLIPFK